MSTGVAVDFTKTGKVDNSTVPGRTLTLIYKTQDNKKYYNLLSETDTIKTTVPYFEKYYNFDTDEKAYKELTQLYNSIIEKNYHIGVKPPNELTEFNKKYKDIIEVNPPQPANPNALFDMLNDGIQSRRVVGGGGKKSNRIAKKSRRRHRKSQKRRKSIKNT